MKNQIAKKAPPPAQAKNVSTEVKSNPPDLAALVEPRRRSTDLEVRIHELILNEVANSVIRNSTTGWSRAYAPNDIDRARRAHKALPELTDLLDLSHELSVAKRSSFEAVSGIVGSLLSSHESFKNDDHQKLYAASIAIELHAAAAQRRWATPVIEIGTRKALAKTPFRPHVDAYIEACAMAAEFVGEAMIRSGLLIELIHELEDVLGIDDV
ncbi:hypothetical protein BMI86_00080 [Thioclava sp. DLFJ5-1]|uniref:hypothetical protein n=1 Tax=Thioclava sp. DLFJ5-1 TaxID=1915314 RepID=UPI00099890EC|nr:hypothetical protein [Thioclava sp. DLFJ5-1]OOY21033.1 hypothetical protein BMI86_00080 [Thioclava sp. DLFJ5-1]